MPAVTPDIRDVDFGRFDAESDQNLDKYFVDTGALDRIGRGERQFVIGRKGSGKTALFKHPSKWMGKSSVVQLEFSDYAWESHKAIVELGLPLENAYTTSWIFTFLVSACRKWMSSVDSSVAERARKVYVEIYGADEVGDLSDILFDRLRRVRRLDGPKMTEQLQTGGVEFSDLPEGSQLAIVATAWNRKLFELADFLFKSKPITIFIDRLDDGWDATPEMRSMIAGAIKAARTINLRFAAKRAPAVVIFLRSDIFSMIQFNDKNKISADIESIAWASDSLLDVASARIAESVPVKKKDAWAAVFSSEQMRQRSYISNYMIKRTMLRPRDMIAFCIFCKEAAVANKHAVVMPQDVYDAETKYSKYMYDELVDEMHKQVPNYDDLFKALHRIGYSKFTLSAWEQATETICGDRDESLKLLQVLFEYAIVGIPKVGGRGGGSRYEFIYENPFLEPNFEGEIVVHPALKKHLRLKDPMAQDSGPEDD